MINQNSTPEEYAAFREILNAKQEGDLKNLRESIERINIKLSLSEKGE